jgi:hypothetical protein
MSQNDAMGYVSIIGFNFLEPITLLLENLLSAEPKDPNEVQAVQNENGISCSIIVLAVLLIESAIARLKYDKQKTSPKGALKFIESEYPSYKGCGELKELFVIRDAIVHNHIWEANFRWDDEAGMRLLAAEIWEGSGDNKFLDVVDMTTRKTKCLKLNLFPTRISRADAFVVLQETVKFLIFVEKNGTPHINIGNQYVTFKRCYISFLDVIQDL